MKKQHAVRTEIIYSIIVLILWLFLSIGLHGQICEGNLGENIFTEGDFGTGQANLLQPDPQIAPGYIYNINPPPFDGSYTVTNNTSEWLGIFPTWLKIGDNSSDPNGYMMVVNASYEPGLFYEQEVDGLCENTLYVFSADIINMIEQLVGNHIAPDVSFLINGIQVYSTGDIAQDNQWNTYGFTFITDPGQTSVTLSLRNNAPGGIGNDLALDNITFRPCGPEALILPFDIANICEDGDPIDLEATIIGDQYDNPAFQWQESFDEGMTWVDIPGATSNNFTHTNLASGFYYYRYLLAGAQANVGNPKCRVISNIKIIHVVPKFYTIIDTLCEGLSFQLANNSYSATGIYVDSLISSLGCDSIVTLDLTIVPDTGIDAIISANDPECSDSEDGSIVIDTVFNGNAPLTYYLDNELYLNGLTISDLSTGNYLLTIKDHYGCSFEEEVILEGPPPFTIDLGPDWIVELGESIRIEPTSSQPVASYIWELEELVNCENDCWILEWVPPNSMSLSMVATSENDCVASDTVSIEVIKNRKVYIPNTFTPNGDGTNDFFTVFADIPNVQKIEKMIVFDRWGGVVFENRDFLPNEQLNGWDGTSKGERLNNGVYVYLAEVLFLDGEKLIYSGDISLVK